MGTGITMAVLVTAAFFALLVAIRTLDVRAETLKELRRIKSPQPQQVLAPVPVEPDLVPDPIVPDREEVLVITNPEPLIPVPEVAGPAWPEPVDWSAYDRPAWIRRQPRWP